MKDLIEALTIFLKYTTAQYPTICAHDAFYVLVDPAVVSAQDNARLDELGFFPVPEDEHYQSFRFGSA